MKDRQRLVDTLPWHDDALLAGSDGEPERFTEIEQDPSWDDDEHWLRIDAEVRYFGGVR